MTYFLNKLTKELLTREEALKEIAFINEALGINLTLTEWVEKQMYEVISRGEE